MAMTLKSLAAQMRAYRPEADEYKGKHIIPSWADALDAIDTHLSAQAKARVTADAVNEAALAYNDSIEKTHDGFDLPWCDEDAMRAALVSFAARLSQGAQGEAKCHRCGATSEAQAETMCIPDGDSCPGCEKPLVDQWSAERVAVPDDAFKMSQSFVDRVTSDSFNEPPVMGAGSHDSIKRIAEEMVHACKAVRQGDGEFTHDAVDDWAHRIMCFADYKKPAAPQPPEGARVVDDREVLGYFSADPAEGEFSRHETLEAARQAAEGLLESAGDEAADWGWTDDPPQICYGVVLGGCEVESRDVAPEGSDFEELVNYRVFGPGAAPTLAGKEGVK